MFRLAQNSSRLFIYSGWFFVVTLFADGANLDDLFSSTDVIHDDEDVASVCSHSLPQPERAAGNQGAKSTDKGLRILIDQDSPSLAAEDCVAAFVNAIISSGTEETAYDPALPSGLLTIKLCTLLL